jgi:hypothetical protein
MATRAGSNTVGDLEEANLLQAEDQFIFLQNTSKKTKRISRKNFFNTPGLIIKGRFISPEGNDVGLATATAINNAATALVTAEGAQTSANGKNRIFYQSAAPTNPISGYTLIQNDLWFDTDGGYRMAKWDGSSWVDYGLETQAIANLDAGKITAGFIGAQVITINGSNGGGTSGTSGMGGYIESTSFVPTWVSGLMTVRQYTTSGTYGNYLGKHIPSDVVQVKVLQSDGSYKLFRSNTNQGANATSGPPASGNNTDWTEITGANIPTFTVPISSTENATIQNFGFRIASNGYGEFAGGLFRGAIIANEGFFGNTKNAARIDDEGLVIGNFGRVKSAGIGYSGTDFTSSGASGGFFLGNTQAEGSAELYQFFIGNPSANFLRWNGTDLIINGKVGVPTGANVDTDAGLEINSGFGIRRSSKDKVLTITGGNGNGITYGAQIDLCGTEFMGSSGLAEGQLILSAGYDSTLTSVNPSRDGCIIFRTSRESNANIGVQRLRIDLDGTVRVVDAGNANAGAPDDGAGNLIVDNSVTAETFTSTSSKRFKKKIRNFKNGLETVFKLRPVIFDWKNKEIKNDIGLIAEEVNEVIPNLVGLNNKGEVVGIDYGKLTPILIQAVKELSLEVQRLKNKIK